MKIADLALEMMQFFRVSGKLKHLTELSDTSHMGPFFKYKRTRKQS